MEKIKSKKIIALCAAAAVTFSAVPAVFADGVTSAPEQAATGETPPDMSSGENGGGDMNGGEMPGGEAPSGEMPGGENGGDMNGGEMQGGMSFTDVAESDWFYEYIRSAYNMGLINGTSDTTFDPQSTVTGAQFLTMLYRADGNTTQDSENWADESIAWAYSNSVLLNENGWDFVSDDALTREQLMALFYRYILYKEPSTDVGGDISAYGDTVDISDYALDAVKTLVSQGIVNGNDGNILPLDTITRAETATVLVRYLGDDTMGGDMNGGGMPGGSMGGFGGSGEVTQGTSANTITEDGTYSNLTYTSTGDDENALRIDGATVTLDGITVSKSAGSSSNTEDGDFYGMNAALLATDGANVTITDATVTSSAQNGNGIFSYGSGTVVTVSDSTITTTADNSGGIQTTGGGTMYANNLTINTSGSSAAAIRSDRGGGTVVVDGGTYTSNGYNSPAVYSTADITVSDAELTANNSEALVIEGENSITLEDCTVYGNMSDTQGTSSDENVHNVMIYQSMSGDAEVGTSEFSMTGGSLTANNGDMFYITNTHCILSLSGVEIATNETDGYLMRISGNSASRGWGTAGANGAQVEFTANAQTLDGDIIVDTISTLDMVLSGSSEFTGTINIVDNEQGGTAVSDNAVITIELGSTWNLTGNCTVTSLENNGTINYNGYTITLADGTVLSA